MDLDDVRRMPEYAGLLQQLQKLLLAKVTAVAPEPSDVKVYSVSSAQSAYYCDGGYDRDVHDDNYRDEIHSVGDSAIGEDLFAPYVPITEGVAGQVVDQFLEIEKEAVGDVTVVGYVDLLDGEELEVLEECTDYSQLAHHRAPSQEAVLTAAVNRVTAISLEEAFGCSKGDSPCGLIRPVANEKVTVPPDVVRVGYGPVAGCLERLFGEGPTLGVVLAWYSRAVSHGYAGAVKLVKDQGQWILGEGTGGSVYCLKTMLGEIRRDAGFRLDKVPGVAAFVTNPNVVKHPYEVWEAKFPPVGESRQGVAVRFLPQCDFLTEHPYDDIVSAVCCSGRDDSLDSALNEAVKQLVVTSFAEDRGPYGECDFAMEKVKIASTSKLKFGLHVMNLPGFRETEEFNIGDIVALYLWLARRGRVLPLELTRDAVGWHLSEADTGTTSLTVMRLIRVAVREVYLNSTRRSYAEDLESLQFRRGFPYPRCGEDPSCDGSSWCRHMVRTWGEIC